MTCNMTLGHMMPLELAWEHVTLTMSIVSLHSLGQDNQNKVQHDFVVIM